MKSLALDHKENSEINYRKYLKTLSDYKIEYNRSIEIFKAFAIAIDKCGKSVIEIFKQFDIYKKSYLSRNELQKAFNGFELN